MKIGFIGLGRMGRGMASRIQAAGYDMVVTDALRSTADPFLQAGAAWAATPREVAAECEVVFVSLPTPAIVEKVVLGENGLAQGFSGSGTCFDLSTNSLSTVRMLHDALAQAGVAFLDAPVSGGPAGAASGKLAILVGGAQDRFERYKPVLDAMSDQPRHIGDIGAGTVAKLVHNIASTAMVAVAAEAMTLGVKAGMEPLQLWEAIRTGVAGRLRSFDNISKRFLTNQLDPATFALDLAFKDVSLGLDMAKDLCVPMRLCDLVQSDMMEALNRGWGDRDAHSFLVLQQERAGVPVFDIAAEEIEQVMART